MDLRTGLLLSLMLAACGEPEVVEFGEPSAAPDAGGGDAARPTDAAPPSAPRPAAGCGPRGETLCPVVDPHPDEPPGPRRDKPTEVVVRADGAFAYVALTGSEGAPGEAVAVVDLADGAVRRLPVGPRPIGLALHPSGPHLVVSSSFARALTVIDTDRNEVVDQLDYGFYAEGVTFTADALLVADRRLDGLTIVPVREAGGRLAFGDRASWRFVPLGVNPSRVSACPGGAHALVTLTGENRVARIGLADGAVAYLDLRAPPNDVLCLGAEAVVATLGPGSGHPMAGSEACEAARAAEGGDEHVHCDTTLAVAFSDVQNELAWIDVAGLTERARYTSDTAEASAADLYRGIPRERMRIGGAFPRRLAAAPGGVVVTYAASAGVQRFSLPDLTPGPVLAAGFGAHGVAVTPAGAIVVANRLAEDLTVIDAAGGARRIPVGQTDPPFPATDVEIGEWYFFGAYLAADGDGSCSHCHPDGTTDGKAWSVATVPRGHSRQVPQTRNLMRSRPLLLEGTQTEDGFNLEMEDLSPRADYLAPGDRAAPDAFEAGAAARDAVFRETTTRLIGREVGFDELVLLVGRFLISTPRLMPNPNPTDTPEVARGRALYRSPAVACDACHPIDDGFTTNELFADVVATRPGDRPNEALPPSIAGDFLNAQPGVFDTPSLRGLWDRPARFLHDGRARTVAETILTPGHPALRPGELGLNFTGGFEPGARIFDSHGGTSHLTPAEVADLLAFLATIE